MRVAETALTTGKEVDVRRFLHGGDHSIKAELQQYAAGLTWMVDAGWAPLHGSTAMLLLACGSAAIGRAIRDRTTEFAASAHALADALRQRALAVSTAAPPTYASIEGTFGVAAADEAWLSLLGPDIKPGHKFITSAPLQASLHPTRLPDPGTGGPIARTASAACQIARGGHVVCFLSEDSTPGDQLRTLLQTSPTSFALPPLAAITLIACLDPGEWDVGEGPIWQRCLCVRVAVAY